MNNIFNTIKSIVSNRVATLEFWYAQKTIKLNRDYIFMVDISKSSSTAIKFTSKYSGVIVEYSNVGLNANGTLGFDFMVIANPESHNIETKKFKQFSNNIMRHIIVTTLKSAKDYVDNYEDKYESRNIDSIESDQEREIHEESDPLLEKRVSKRKIGSTSTRRNKKIHQ